MSDTTDTMPDVIWVEKYRRVMRETPPPMYLSEYEEYVKRSLMDDLQAQLKRRCACEFVDGKCVEPCKYHSELQKRLDEKDERIATLEKQRDNPWISVDERLPEEDLDCRSVLAVAKKKVAYIDYYRRVDDHWGSGNNVTHWMPIPTNTNRGINMKTELIEKLIGMLLDGETPTSGEKEMIGDYVIVRCRDAGVHAGTLVSYEGREVVLKNSRRLWYWKCANNQHSLSGVAEEGITQESKIPAMVRKIVLGDACEIISTSDKCQRSIQDAKVHKTA